MAEQERALQTFQGICESVRTSGMHSVSLDDLRSIGRSLGVDVVGFGRKKTQLFEAIAAKASEGIDDLGDSEGEGEDEPQEVPKSLITWRVVTDSQDKAGWDPYQQGQLFVYRYNNQGPAQSGTLLWLCRDVETDEVLTLGLVVDGQVHQSVYPSWGSVGSAGLKSKKTNKGK